ncbi:MAG TPA: NAD(P)-dependent oxidoreductase [Polyangiaceae bacterium]
MIEEGASDIQRRLAPLRPGTRCLVTGATGHVGVHLVRALLRAGAEVVALARPDTDLSRLPSGATAVIARPLDRDALATSIAATAPEVLFHLAWLGVRRETLDDPRQITQNVPHTLFVVEAALRAGARAVVGLGSQEEYGRTSGVLDELAELRPTDAYGRAKQCAGALTLDLARTFGTRAAWLRLFISYGPLENASRLIPSVTRALLLGEPLALTDGPQRRDYLFVEDVAEALLASAASDASGVYNLGSGSSRSVRSVVEDLRSILAPERELTFGALASQARDQTPVLEADARRFRAATGWAPRTSMREGLEKTVAWHRADLGLMPIEPR